MTAVFAWSESNGPSETVTDSISNVNFGSTDSVNLVPSTYPITAGTNSFEKWIRGKWSSSFTRIENLQFFKSAGGYATQEAIYWKGNNAGSFVQPTTATSTVATIALPTSDPGTANVSIGGSLSGSLTATGYSDYIVMQDQIGSGASAGAVPQKTLTLQYDEV